MKIAIATCALVSLLVTGCDSAFRFSTEDTSSGGAGAAGGGGSNGVPEVCEPGDKRACYTGPAGTKGIGICMAGQETCNEDGSAFGACEGETLPKLEDCKTQADEDCGGTAPDCGGLRWAKRFGDAHGQDATAVAMDPSGAVLVTGSTMGEVDFGAGVVPNVGQVDIFVVKLGPDGSHVWSKRFGDPGAVIGNPNVQSGASIAADAAGNILVTGSLWGAVDFGGGAVGTTGTPDAFVVKLAPDGSHLWSKSYGTGGSHDIESVATDEDGNVLVTGHFSGTVDFGGDPLTANGPSNVFVAKLGPDGSDLWSRSYGTGDGDARGWSIATDTAGNVLMTGWCSGATDFGGGPLASPGTWAAFVVKLGPDGSYVWGRAYVGAGGASIATDAAGNVLVTGSFSGAVDFGGGPLIGKGISDAFVVKLAPDGSYLWSKSYGDGNKDGTTFSAKTATDSMGNVLVTGPFQGAVDFGGGALGGVGLDVFTLGLDPTGSHRWSYRYGDDQKQIARSIATDLHGNVFVVGPFLGSIDFGTGPLTSAGDYDIFVAAFAP